MIGRIIKISVINVAFGLSCYLNGQELLPVVLDTTLANEQLKIVGNAFTSSTSIRNEFSRKFLFGGEIEESLAKKVAKRQKDYNRLGGGYRIRGEFRAKNQVFKAHPDWSWMIDITQEAHLSAEFSDELIGLGFVGNEMYLGKEVTVAGTAARWDQFLAIGGGLHNRKTKSFVTLNLVLPQSFFEVDVAKGYFGFSELGDHVTAEIKADIVRENPSLYFKGVGAAVNFDFNIPFGSPETYNGIIGVTARSLGFFSIHKSVFSKVETQQDFSGLPLDDIINTEDFGGLVDSLGVNTYRKTMYRMLPGFFQIGKVVSADHPKKIQSFFGVRMYATKGYKPLIYAGAHYQPIRQFSLGVQGAFGGYANFRLGFYLNYTADSFVVSAGSEDVLGMISKSQYGHSGLIRIAWKF